MKLVERSLGLNLLLILPHIMSWTWCVVPYSEIWHGLVQIDKLYVKSYIPGMQVKDNRLKINFLKIYLMISTSTANRYLKITLFLKNQISLPISLI